MRFLNCLVIALTVLATQIASADSIDYEFLDKRLEQLMERDDMMGLAVAVVENGDIKFARGYGLVEENGAKVNAHTRFRWASVSKGLSGTLAAQLDYEGQLSLDDTVTKYKTTLKLPGAGEAKATLSDILSHQLGIVSNAYDNKLEEGKKPADIRKTLGGLNIICPVNDCHGYQNVAFDTISEVFQEITGNEFEKLVKSKVFQPLGMTTASTTYEGYVGTGNYARPYSWSRSRKELYRDKITMPYFRVATAGGVSSSITDLAKYMQAQMGAAPHVFHPEALKAAHEPRVATWRERNGMRRRYEGVNSAEYGLGWRVYDYQGHRLVGHRGAVRGTRALIFFDPERKTGVAALWNSNVSRPTGIQFEVMDMIYGLPKRDWLRLLPDEPKTN